MPQDASALEREPYNRVLFLGDPHIGKAQPIDEPVLTPTGWRSIGSLKIGDEVIGSDGRAVRVTGVFQRGALPIFKLTTDDGCSTRCCGAHLWHTVTKAELRRPRWAYPTGPHHERQGKVRTEIEWGPGTVKTTEEIARSLPPADALLTNVSANRIHYLPRVSHPIEFEAPSDLPIHPYFLGLLLGDGSFSSQATNISFTSADDELIQLVQACASIVGDTAVRHDSETHCPWVHFRGTKTRRALEALELFGCRSEQKHVPRAYLYASPSDRLELLRGLCDTDGSVVRQVSGKNKGVGLVAEYCTTSERLRDAVVFIVRSLGGRAYVRWKPTPMSQNGPGLPAWLVLLTFADGTCPFLLARKAAAWAPLREKLYRQRIVSIEPAGEAECVCITVDAPDHLYVTNDFLVTHNSTSIVSSAADAFGLGYVINCGKKTGLSDARHRTAQNFKWDLIRDEVQMEEALKEARRGSKDGTYKWIVIDDYNMYASWLEGALEDQTRNQKGEPDGRRYWREYRKRLINILVRCFDMKAHLYVISHYIETGGGLIDGQTEKTGFGVAPLFGGAARKEIPGMFGDVVFMAPHSKEVGRRSFYINPVGVYGPSCLSAPGTHEIDCDVGLLYKEFEKAAKAAKQPLVKVSSNPRSNNRK